MEHTHLVLRKSDNVFIDVLNIETGSRGYVLTGDESFLESYSISLSLVLNNVSELAELTRDNPGQTLRIAELM